MNENETKTKTLIINRKKKFASALMPYWIIAGISKRDFIQPVNDDIGFHV